MTKTLRNFSLFGLIGLMVIVAACKKKDPSLLKVFVRSSSNELVTNAKVVIIADVNSDPATPAYVDTILTNTSGFASFDMEPFFEPLGKKETTGYFDILVSTNVPSEGTEYVRVRKYNTAVKTVYLNP